MYRDRFRFGLGVVLGMALVTGGCGAPGDEDLTGSAGGWRTIGCDIARVPPRVTVGDITVPTTPPDLQAAMDRIDRSGRGEFAGSFAGLEVDQERVRAIVYRVPSEAFDDFIRREAGNSCIVVRDAPHSAADLTAWHDRVLADLPYWKHHGVNIVSIGARHDGTGVEIGTNDVDKTRADLMARYGPGAPLVFVDQAPVRPLNPRINPNMAPPTS